METRTRVALAEGDGLYLSGLKSLLHSSPCIDVVGCAVTADEVLTMVEQTVPDILILEVAMTGAGITLIESIASRSPATRTVVLTALEDGDMAIKAFRAGAFAYLTKRVAGGGLLSALRSVAAGELFLEPQFGYDLLAQRSSNRSIRPRMNVRQSGSNRKRMTEGEHLLQAVQSGCQIH